MNLLSDVLSLGPSSGIPAVFCWTKMGTEAGQPLEVILRRKEFERQAGNGTFAWGIGNSLGNSPSLAKRSVADGQLEILFSPMKSAAKSNDVAPAQLVLWLSYYSENSKLVDLPAHMLVTSRGNGASGAEKRSHYALLCERKDEIRPGCESGILDAKYTRNFISQNPLGASQVTAMVSYEHDPLAPPENPYPVAFRARMHNEGFVRLGTSVPLTGALLSAYRSLGESADADTWLEGVIALKQQAWRIYRNRPTLRQPDLFDI